jgi:hypothetical protein
VNVSYKLSLTADDVATLPQGDYSVVLQYAATTNWPTSTDRTTQEVQEGGAAIPPPLRLSSVHDVSWIPQASVTDPSHGSPRLLLF